MINSLTPDIVEPVPGTADLKRELYKSFITLRETHSYAEFQILGKDYFDLASQLLPSASGDDEFEKIIKLHYKPKSKDKAAYPIKDFIKHKDSVCLALILYDLKKTGQALKDNRNSDRITQLSLLKEFTHYIAPRPTPFSLVPNKFNTN